MKISLTQHGQTHTIETEHDGQDMQDVKEMLKRLLVSAGYHPRNVDDLFADDGDSWFEYERDQEIEQETKDKVVSHPFLNYPSDFDAKH